MLSIMRNRPVSDQCEFPSKMERYFPIKPGQPIGMALATICFSSEFPRKGKGPVCQKWNDKFPSEYSDRNKWTTFRGDPQRGVIPNISVGRNRNGLFHLNSNRNLRNLWHNGKHSITFYTTLLISFCFLGECTQRCALTLKIHQN